MTHHISPHGNQTKTLRLRRGDRKVLESWVPSRTLPRRPADRAKILLGAARGESSGALAKTVGVARDTARRWIRRYEEEGLGAVERDRPHPGRPRKLTPELEAEIVGKTVNEDAPPGDTTYRTSGLVPRAVGISHTDVWRTWRKYGLSPRQIRRFKMSLEPQFVEKFHDVVGIYLNPPDNALVFSFDEKSQIPALDRTKPGLALKPGRAGTMTHDDKRPGTTTLSAALAVATGEVIHECMPRHRHQEFLKFVRRIEATVEPGLDIHVVLDDCATHKHGKVRRWLERHPGVKFHVAPTGASWLNLVERLFSALAQRQLKRLAVTSIGELIAAIETYLNHRNEDRSHACGQVRTSSSESSTVE